MRPCQCVEVPVPGVVDDGVPCAVVFFLSHFAGVATTGSLLSTNPGTVTGISFSPAGMMYFSTAPGPIFTADPNTAVDTLVGNSGTTQWNDIAFDAAGDLYGWNNTTLYLINTANASVSVVGNAAISETSMTFVGSTLHFHHQRRAHEDWQYWRYRRSGNCRGDSGAGHMGCFCPESPQWSCRFAGSVKASEPAYRDDPIRGDRRWGRLK